MAFNFVGGKKYTIAGSGVSSTASTIVLTSFKLPVSETAITMADFGDIGYGTIEPGGTRQEFISFTGVTQNANGTATLTGVVRGLKPISGYTTDNDYKVSHSGGASFIISNTPGFYTEGTFKRNNEAITGAWTFPTPTASSSPATKAYVDSLVNGGTVSYDQIIEAGTAGETVVAGDLVYFDLTDNEWKKCDADTAATVENVKLGIAQGAGTNGNNITGGVLTRGLDTNQSGMSQGDLMYASNTAGDISSSTGTTEKVIGIARNTTNLYFDPDFYYTVKAREKAALAGGGDFGTPSSANKFITENYLSSASVVKFGGSGADGALSVTSGTTTLDLAGASVFVKNYSSISISVGATLAFSNPASAGTIIILKTTGDSTIAGTIDASGMGAVGGAGGSGSDGANGSAGSAGIGLLGTELVAGRGGDGGAGTAGTTYSTNKLLYTKSSNQLFTRSLYIYAGNGGGGGEAGDSPDTAAGGAGGAGGGGILIECRGALDFSGVINTSGANGTAGSAGTSSSGGGGGGGGGSAGAIVVLYNSLTANTGTLTSEGGDAGGGGAGSGGDLSTRGGGGGGGGSYTAVGGTGAGANSNGGGAGGAGAGGGGGGGQTTGGATTGGAGGATESGLVAQNIYL